MTASKFKAAACTDLSQPSQSLLKVVCYPESYRFSTIATRWGCEHEKTARDAYVKKIVDSHVNFIASDRGLVIHPQFPHFGATPDGFIKCDCCGCGVIEVKCPFSCKSRSFLEASEDTTFCLEIADGKYNLKRKHAYFYQIQLQMKLCEVEYGDFIVWSGEELVVLRIEKDEAFLREAMDKATSFFKYGVLPELLAKWYTRLPLQDSLELRPSESTTSSTRHETTTERHYCYCNEVESGEMIGCDDENCFIQWFHVDCLKIKTIPKGAWYCPECRKKTKKKRTK